VNTGGRYNPAKNSWTATSTTNVPDSRYHHTAVWTGSVMIIWEEITAGSRLRLEANIIPARTVGQLPPLEMHPLPDPTTPRPGLAAK